MRLNNETDYRTRDIKKILTAVHNHVARAEGRLPQWRRVVFRVCYTRNRTTSGHAYLNGYRSTLRFRRPDGRPGLVVTRDEDGKVVDWKKGRLPDDYALVWDVIRLGYHELMHLYGYRHEQMAAYWPPHEEVEEIAAAAGFDAGDPLPTYAEPEPADPTEREKAEAALRAALEKRKEWTTKAKRAKTYLAKYRRRENAARRKLESLGIDPDDIRADVLGGYDPAMPGDLNV